jgi:hypothetical protein
MATTQGEVRRMATTQRLGSLEQQGGEATHPQLQSHLWVQCLGRRSCPNCSTYVNSSMQRYAQQFKQRMYRPHQRTGHAQYHFCPSLLSASHLQSTVITLATSLTDSTHCMVICSTVSCRGGGGPCITS